MVGDRVLKWKKALDLGSADFRSLEAWERACRAEVDLNRSSLPSARRTRPSSALYGAVDTKEDLSMQLADGVEGVRRRAYRVVARVGGSAVDNALSAAQVLTTQIAQRRALAPVDAGGPGELAGLSRSECLLLLATRQVGRIAYVARAGLPDIVPVNYVLDGEDVLVRSGPGPKLQAAERGDVVAFQVDDVDEGLHTGWSVVVVGRARRLRAAEPNRVERVPQPWAVGPRSHLMRITPTRITGRRLT